MNNYKYNKYKIRYINYKNQHAGGLHAVRAAKAEGANLGTDKKPSLHEITAEITVLDQDILSAKKTLDRLDTILSRPDLTEDQKPNLIKRRARTNDRINNLTKELEKLKLQYTENASKTETEAKVQPEKSSGSTNPTLYDNKITKEKAQQKEQRLLRRSSSAAEVSSDTSPADTSLRRSVSSIKLAPISNPSNPKFDPPLRQASVKLASAANGRSLTTSLGALTVLLKRPESETNGTSLQ